MYEFYVRVANARTVHCVARGGAGIPTLSWAICWCCATAESSRPHASMRSRCGRGASQSRNPAPAKSIAAQPADNAASAAHTQMQRRLLHRHREPCRTPPVLLLSSLFRAGLQQRRFITLQPAPWIIRCLAHFAPPELPLFLTWHCVESSDLRVREGNT